MWTLVLCQNLVKATILMKVDVLFVTIAHQFLKVKLSTFGSPESHERCF